MTIPLESLVKTSQNVPQTELLFDRQSLPRHKPLPSQLAATLLLQFTQDKTPRGVLNCSPVHSDSNPPLHCCPGAEPRPPTVTAPPPRSPSAAHPLHSIQLELKVKDRSCTLLRSQRWFPADAKALQQLPRPLQRLAPASSALHSSSVPALPSRQSSRRPEGLRLRAPCPCLECPHRQLAPSSSVYQMSPPQPALSPSFTTVTSDSLPGCFGLVYLFIMLPACPRTQAP